MMLVSLISYIDRNTLALLIPTIMRETNLSAEQYGFIVSAFSIAYMIGSPLWGGLLDRLGLRLGMMIAVAFWTAASMSHAAAAGFLSFAIARTALGFGEGATFPGGLRTVVQTLPPDNRHAASAWRTAAVRSAPSLLRSSLRPSSRSGDGVQHFYSPAGSARRGSSCGSSSAPGPRSVISKRVSRAEAPAAATGGRPDVGASCDRCAALELILAYGLGATPLGFVMYAAALYLNQALGKDQLFLGKVLWIPPLGWELGYFFWGWLVDRMTSAGISTMTTVRRLMFVSVFLSLPLAAVPWVSSTALVLFEMFIATFVIVGFVVPSLKYATHVYSRSRSGLIAGIGAGSYGAIVAVTMPLFGRLFDMRRYDLAFAIAAVLPALGYAGMGVDQSRGGEPREARGRGIAARRELMEGGPW
jgi:ACS family hexuronate transporter-like MFS transporter